MRNLRKMDLKSLVQQGDRITQDIYIHMSQNIKDKSKLINEGLITKPTNKIIVEIITGWHIRSVNIPSKLLPNYPLGHLGRLVNEFGIYSTTDMVHLSQIM